MAGRTTDVGVRLTADAAQLRAGIGEAIQEWAKYGQAVQQSNAKAAGAAAAMGGAWRQGAGGMMAMGAQVFGGYGIVQTVQGVKAFESALVDVTVSANENRTWMTKLRADVLGVSDRYGIAKEDVLAFSQTIVKQTGDAKLATGSLSDMAQVAHATGAKMSDLASIGIQIQNKMGIAPEKWKESFGSLVVQAQKGAVEVNDFAAEFPALISYADRFGHKGPEAVKAYGALFQVARRNNTSVAETSTSVQRFFDMIIEKAPKIEKALGIKLSKGGVFYDLPTMLKSIGVGMNVLERKKGAVKAMAIGNDLFDIRGGRTAVALGAQARAGWGNNVGSYASIEDLLKGGDASAIDAMSSKRSGLSPGVSNWNRAVTQLSNTAQKEFLPLMLKLGEIMPRIGEGLRMVLANWDSLLALWAGSKMYGFLMALRGAAMGGAGAAGTAAAAGSAANVLPWLGGAAGVIAIASIILPFAYMAWKNKDQILDPSGKKKANREIESNERASAFERKRAWEFIGEKKDEARASTGFRSAAFSAEAALKESTAAEKGPQGAKDAAMLRLDRVRAQLKTGYMSSLGYNAQISAGGMQESQWEAVIPEFARLKAAKTRLGSEDYAGSTADAATTNQQKQSDIQSALVAMKEANDRMMFLAQQMQKPPTIDDESVQKTIRSIAGEFFSASRQMTTG